MGRVTPRQICLAASQMLTRERGFIRRYRGIDPPYRSDADKEKPARCGRGSYSMDWFFWGNIVLAAINGGTCLFTWTMYRRGEGASDSKVRSICI